MNEQVARDVVLVRAIESADAKHEVLSDEDRKYASRSAKELAAWQAADSKTAVTSHHFLQQRSEQILKRLGERTPAFGAFARRKLGLSGIWLALPFLALVSGAAIDRIADPHRVDLLSAPFLVIIGWNLLVYLFLLVWALVPGKRHGWAGPNLLRRLSVGKAVLPRKLPGPLANGVTAFMGDWAALSEPLARARLSRTIHLAAACFALGAIASLYARGLLTQYVVGWESTFLAGRDVHTLLSWLFMPSMSIFPFLQGFSLTEIELLRFGRAVSTASGERWVHLYGATLLLLVVLPRLLLAAVAAWRARRLSRDFPLDLDQPYYRKLADSIGAGSPALLRVFPYSYTLDEARDRGLWAIAAAALGGQARVQLRPAISYGIDAKEALQDTVLDEPGVTVTAVLFSLAATPENENHGAILDYLAKRVRRGVAVLVDESAFIERAGEKPDHATRLAERVALWRQFCSFHGTSATFVNLVQPDKYPVELGAGLALPELR
ncbi:DUF2868 domain-containing protein [Telluria aromaticivorans]|uniref:DUF2868 domain-containing protein n=1 Tax=Telluria aromaticivorans TaxID=2725995 RepID=A0A7Y2K432_9BURK|nr:DUF2868 domain-containing protein [Telluria aromaticivorans]NNG25868.1 DUF2868 domain-containing protein [Telluria aromaticivorans]